MTLAIEWFENSNFITFNWEYYSCWDELVWHVALMIEVKQNWLACISSTQKPNLKTVTVSELQECQLNLLRFCQNELHQEETLSLWKDNPFPKNSTILSSDSKFTDKLLGVQLKLTKFSLKCHSQVIVNKNHPLAALIIKYHHEINLHSGRKQNIE